LKCSCSGLLFGVSVQGSCSASLFRVIPNLFRDLVLILSTGDGGPLTDNVVFTAISGFSAFKGTAVLILATWNSQLLTALRRTGP
ncbi:hypothetical protein, partial [Mesotoga sp. HF07.pep.5.2.highcov]|uniref:hypothetical protein n=1 Tax=Mesotoga sp. HF07.pep.5.2.highcov TaxID=1462923 RepID=UPI0011C3B074